MNEDLEWINSYWIKEDHKGNESFEDLRCLKQLHKVCLANFEEINEICEHFAQHEVVNNIFKSKKIEPEISRFIRCLYNYVSSSIARKELYFSFVNRYPDLKVDFGKDRIKNNISTIQFVECLRNFILHSRVPEFRLFCNLQSSGSRSGIALSEKHVVTYINKKESGEKKNNSLTCIHQNTTKQGIELSKPLLEYGHIMYQHYSEFFDVTVSTHKANYPDYHDNLRTLNISL